MPRIYIDDCSMKDLDNFITLRLMSLKDGYELVVYNNIRQLNDGKRSVGDIFLTGYYVAGSDRSLISMSIEEGSSFVNQLTPIECAKTMNKISQIEDGIDWDKVGSILKRFC